MNTLKDVYIVDGVRTPIGKPGGCLKSISAIELGAVVIRELKNRYNLESDSIDEVIFGNVVSAGLGQNPARQALIHGGFSAKVPGFTLNKVCGSGLKAVQLAYNAIKCQDANMIIAGGMESASNSPYVLNRNDDFEKDLLRDSLLSDGLYCAFKNDHMGVIAEDTSSEHGISREAQDEYALCSQSKALLARDNGLFTKEIIPVEIEGLGKIYLDENIREDTSMKKLARIPTPFKPKGTVTAGNSPRPADGAAALIIASERAMSSHGLKPTAIILSSAVVAVEPEQVFTAPSLAIQKCLKSVSLKLSDVDVFELIEAFAVQALLTIKLTGIEPKKMNLFGGAIALGHPLGASGARGLVTLLNILRSENKKIGVVAVCLGGGCALAMAVKTVE